MPPRRSTAAGRTGEQPGVLDDVEVALVVDVLARPQLAHDVERFDEHVLAHVRRRPAIAGDVLVQRLARADTEEEAASAELRAVAAAWAITVGW
jgi:hypothetical protein